MLFENKLVKGKLTKKYKRFLTDVKLEDGTSCCSLHKLRKHEKLHLK